MTVPKKGLRSAALGLTTLVLAAQLAGCRPATPAPTSTPRVEQTVEATASPTSTQEPIRPTSTPRILQTVEPVDQIDYDALIEQYFADRGLPVPEGEITLDDLWLSDGWRYNLTNANIDPYYAIPFIVNDFWWSNVLNFSAYDLTYEQVHPFTAFTYDYDELDPISKLEYSESTFRSRMIVEIGHEAARILGAGKTFEDTVPFYEMGVEPRCLSDAVLLDKPLYQKEYLVSRGVSGCELEELFENHSFGEMVDWLDLFNGDGNLVQQVIDFSNADLNLAREYREAGFTPEETYWLFLNAIAREPISIEKGLEYKNNGTPICVIRTHESEYPELSIEEIAPYFQRFWSYFEDNYFGDSLFNYFGYYSVNDSSCHPAVLRTFFDLVGYPMDKIQELVDSNVFPKVIHRILKREDVDEAIQRIKPLTELGFRDENLIYFLDDNITVEQITPYLEIPELRERLIKPLPGIPDYLLGLYFVPGSLCGIIEEGIGPQLMWEYTQRSYFFEGFDNHMMIRMHQNNISPAQIDELTDLYLQDSNLEGVNREHETRVITLSLYHSINAGFTYDEFYSAVEAGYDPEHIMCLSWDFQKDEVMDILEAGLQADYNCDIDSH